MEQQTDTDGKWPFESLWLRQQVETHIFFGLVVRKLNLAWVFLAVGILAFLLAVAATKLPLLDNLASHVQILLVAAAAAVSIFKTPREQQATVGWIAVKGALGVTALLLMTVGAFISHVKGQSDELPNVLLGLVWVPWLEFVPTVTPHQKFVTLARVVLTIPLVFWGVQTGYWHW